MNYKLCLKQAPAIMPIIKSRVDLLQEFLLRFDGFLVGIAFSLKQDSQSFQIIQIKSLQALVGNNSQKPCKFRPIDIFFAKAH